jgi:hypothetical protein
MDVLVECSALSSDVICAANDKCEWYNLNDDLNVTEQITSCMPAKMTDMSNTEVVY